MQPKIIEVKQAPVVLVELPKGAYYENLCFLPPAPGINYFLYENGVNTPYKERLPNGNWSILSRADEVTEEHAQQIKGLYTGVNFLSDPPKPAFFDFTGLSEFKGSATESLDSLYKANEVYWENPYRDPGLIPSAELDTYRKAQQNVWDKKRTYLLIKEE